MSVNRPARKLSGFTLIEVVVGIVVSAIALTFLSALFFSGSGNSVKPLMQIRAAEFAQSLMEEILAKPFDENTPVGGIPACTVCTAQGDLGFDSGEELSPGVGDRSLFDDVDDYDYYCNDGSPFDIRDAFGNTLNNFTNYRMSICVVYDGDFNGVDDSTEGVNNVSAKLITVTVFPPSSVGGGISFSAYKGNY